jgi:hypothetical protein
MAFVCRNKEGYSNSHSGQPVSQPRFELSTLRILVYSVTTTLISAMYKKTSPALWDVPPYSPVERY